jgi:RNA polymerase sigma-70 factor (ECF subfamily)
VTELCRRYERHLYRFAVQVLGDPALAEEMVPEVFQRLCRCAASHDGRPDRPGAFLFRLAGSVAADIRGRQPPGPRPGGAGLPPLPAVDQVLDTLALRAALGQLSSPYAEVLSLAIKERRTHADVARRLGMPVEDAGTRALRALRALRSALGSEVPGQAGLAHAEAADWALGTLGTAGAAEFRCHLAACAPCRAAVACFAPVARLLQHLPPAVEPPPDLRARIMAGIMAGAAAPRVSLPPPELARLAQVRPGSLLETAS